MKMDADVYYGEYLKAEDVKKDMPVKIRDVEIEKIDNEEKLVVEFYGVNKRLVLNKTNKDRIKKITGTSETDNWKMQDIVLTVETVQYKGGLVPALRVKEGKTEATAS